MWWRVPIDADGQPGTPVPIEGPPDTEWLVVEADDAEEAGRLARNLYARRKRKQRIAQLHAEGRCRCGRPQDRPGKLTCRVCAEGRARSHEKRSWRSEAPPIVRDEEQRIASLQQRQRDRRAEIRLETLLEVRDWWQKAPHTLAFAQRLVDEIKGCGRQEAVKLAGVEVSSGGD